MYFKKSIFYPKKLFIIILVNILIIINCSIDLNLKNPHALSLLNGNIFIIHENGVNVYNYNYTICLYNYNFNGNKLISLDIENNFISIIQCPDNDKYVLAFIYNRIYIFSSRGYYLFDIKNLDSHFSDFQTTESIFADFSFLYYKNENSIYYFIISYRNNINKIKIINFKIDMNNKSFEVNKEFSYDVLNLQASCCQIMSDSLETNILACFYVISTDYVMYASLFDIDDNFEKIYNDDLQSGSIFIPVSLIKVSVGKGKDKAFISLIYSERYGYLIFDVNKEKYSSLTSLTQCTNKDKIISINYFKYTNEFVISCKYNSTINYAIYKDDINLQTNLFYAMDKLSCDKCLNFSYYYLLLLPYEKKYIIITNSLCDESNYYLYNNFPFIPDICESPDVFPDSSSFYTSTFPLSSTDNNNIKINSTSPFKIESTINISILTEHHDKKTTIISSTFSKIKTTLLITTIPNKLTIFTTIQMSSHFINSTAPFISIYPIYTTITISSQNKYIIINSTFPQKIKTNIMTTSPQTIKNITPASSSQIIKTITPTTLVQSIESDIPKISHQIIKTTILIKSSLLKKTTIPITSFQSIKKTTISSSNIYNSKSTYLSLSTLLLNTPISSEFIMEYNCPLKCSKCNSESLILNLCLKCNTKEKYYPFFNNENDYYECYNEETKISNYFFNQETQFYEPCFPKCKTCNYQGNNKINNCTSCKNGYIFKPNEINSTNCVQKCDYYYYIDIFKQYFCTDNNQCPDEAGLLIRNKGKCIDNCTNDNEYKYQFNYECLNECPEDTKIDENNVCQVINNKKCYLYQDNFLNINFKILESNNFTSLIKRYINSFNDTDFHVDFYKSQNFTLTIYKTIECLKELEMVTSIIDFEECYKKVQKNNFIYRKLIIVIADFFDDKKLEKTYFYFFNPDTGEKLSIEKDCNEEIFTIERSLIYYPQINIEQAKFFEEQDINIFNSSDVFYNDLCIFFESPNGKDVPLRERIIIFFPNITLCDEGCNNIGVNLTTMKVICECTLRDLLSETEEASKLLGLDFGGFVDSLSIDVIKCYKTIFQYKYLARCYGGFLSLILIILQTICVIITYKISIYEMKKTTFWIVESYTIFIKSQDMTLFPPKKKKIFSNKLNDSDINDNTEEMKSRLNQKSFKSPLIKLQRDSTEIFKKNRTSTKKTIFLIKKKKSSKKITQFKTNENTSISQPNKEINLKEYLKTSMDDLDYDEAIEKENRKFCKIFADRLIIKQMLINIFYNNNWIIPRTIKFIFFIVRIDLYLVVNALFYNEEYIRDLYYSEKEETFLSFVPRSLNRIIYTTVVSGILDFIISLLFPSENKIKKILLRKKYNIIEVKTKIYFSIKNIISNYKIFIIISYFLTIISWYYNSCFNNVYPYLKIEWIKSSIFIIIVMQIISFIECLLFSFLRFISIKCKSEKIYRFSSYFSG